MTDQVRVPERAAVRIQTALRQLEQVQQHAQQIVDTVADTLDVPQGAQLGRDETGFYFVLPQAAARGAEDSG